MEQESITLKEWNRRVDILEKFFEGRPLPDKGVYLKGDGNIVDCHRFVKTSLATIKEQRGNMTYYCHMTLLRRFMKWLEAEDVNNSLKS